jgi:hypothetical protein
MPAGRNIQVYGIEAVMACYENNKIPAWAVVCDKNINAKYTGDCCDEGLEMLQQYLEMLKKYDSAASYSLRLYEDAEKQIRSNSPYDIAFNFSLQEKDELKNSGNLPAVQGMNGNTLTQLLREISSLETQNAVLKLEKEQDEDYIDELEKRLKEQPAEQKTMGAAMLEKFMPTIAKIGESIAANLFSKGESALAGVPVSEQDEQALIDNAIAKLRTKLTKYTVGQVLSKIADTEQERLDFYLNMLMK